MTIGEALAEARNKAGLSVDQVSERTRIRETVIRGIELDDYDACGGDLYIRGYVRVIAGAVGIDAQPLIREYDLTHPGGKLPVVSEEPPTTIDPVPPGLGSAESAWPVPPTPSAQPAPPPPAPTAPQPVVSEPPTLIESIIPGMQPIESAASATPVPAASATPGMITPEHVASEPLTPQPRPPLVTAASRPVSAPGVRPRPRQPTQPTRKVRKHSRRWGTGIVALAVVVLAAAGFAASRIVSSLLNSSAKTTAASSAAGRGASASPGTAESKPGVATKGSGTKTATSPATTPTPNPSASAAPPSSTPLHVTLAEAFGPSGVGDGDNPQVALSPITPGASSPWQTNWYTTADFGRLKQGTGLLLDMGGSATITSVRITLGSTDGADLQLRVGDTPALADLPVVASASDVGGTVDLRLAHAATARYVLIWFTQLPPDSAGTYQASVYQVRVSGQP